MIDRDLWKKGWALLDARERRYAWIVLAVVLVSAVSAVAMVGSVMPFLSVLAEPGRIDEVAALAWAYEAGGFDSRYDFLVALGMLSILVILLSALTQILRVYVVTHYTTMRIHTLSLRLLSCYLRQPYTSFLDGHTGDMGTQVLSETTQVVNEFFRPAAELIASAVTALAIVAFLLWASPVVTVIAFAVLGGAYGGTFLLTRRWVVRLGTVRAKNNAARYRMAGEALGGVKEIKLLGREQAYLDRYSTPSRRMVRSTSKVRVLSQVPLFVVQALTFIGMLLLCLVLMSPGDLEGGTPIGGILPLLGLFAVAGQRLIPELARVYTNATKLSFSGQAVRRVHADMMRHRSDVDLPRRPPPALGLTRALELDGLGYRYSGSDRPNLEGISLTVARGDRVGLVGATGSGKSTLANLILGLLTPTEGRIVVDGEAVTADTLRAWQQTLGYVPQDIFLIDATVAENIALGLRRDEIDIDRVRRATAIARIDRFVTEELPQGYDTMVGERGVRLSGGQRQRIGIARAMYHDADLILLDEATSALDTTTEAEVMQAIEALPGDKTLIMIAHRLSTLRSCNRIVLLDQGRLVYQGSWAEVHAASPEFRRMADAANVA